MPIVATPCSPSPAINDFIVGAQPDAIAFADVLRLLKSFASVASITIHMNLLAIDTATSDRTQFGIGGALLEVAVSSSASLDEMRDGSRCCGCRCAQVIHKIGAT